MGMEKLMEFRTTYLRAVAKAWADDAFKAKLIGNPIEVMDRYFKFQWPWAKICDLVIEESENFRWIGNDWVWSRDLLESLTLYLPLEPPAVPAGTAKQTQAMALAEFYRQRASLFSDDWGMEDDPNQQGGPPGLVTPLIGPGSGPRSAASSSAARSSPPSRSRCSRRWPRPGRTRTSERRSRSTPR